MKTIFCCTAMLILMLAGCSKHDEKSYPGPYGVSLVVENSLGQSLFSPETPGYFKQGSVKRYDLINGEKVLFHRGNLTYSDGFVIANEAGKSFLKFAPNYDDNLEHTTTYFQWSAEDADTIVCSFKPNQFGKYNRLTEIRYNNIPYRLDTSLEGYPGSFAFKVVK